VINAVFNFCSREKRMNDCQMAEFMVDHVASSATGVITDR
jgi:hypothetical protein